MYKDGWNKLLRGRWARNQMESCEASRSSSCARNGLWSCRRDSGTMADLDIPLRGPKSCSGVPSVAAQPSVKQRKAVNIAAGTEPNSTKSLKRAFAGATRSLSSILGCYTVIYTSRRCVSPLKSHLKALYQGRSCLRAAWNKVLATTPSRYMQPTSSTIAQKSTLRPVKTPWSISLSSWKILNFSSRRMRPRRANFNILGAF